MKYRIAVKHHTGWEWTRFSHVPFEMAAPFFTDKLVDAEQAIKRALKDDWTGTDYRIVESDEDGNFMLPIEFPQIDGALRKAITRVFDDGQQNWDRGDGWPPRDPVAREAYELVRRLTTYGLEAG